MFRLQVTVIRQTFQYMDMTCLEMSAWWWLLVTETCNKLYIIEYIVVFWLNDFLVRKIFLFSKESRPGVDPIQPTSEWIL
jgi:hypothetical protein